MMPSVSVVIPTHNRSGLLIRAIDSALAQDRPAEEIVVVDDCSTDDTSAAVAAYGSRVRYLRLERNQERGAARNAGARVARSELVAFLDSDDEWESSKLGIQIRRLGRASASVTGGVRINERGNQLGGSFEHSETGADRIFLYNHLTGGASSLLIRRSILNEVGGFPEGRQLQGSEDWLFFAALTAAGHRIAAVGEPLLRYRVHPQNSTKEADNLARSMWWACEQIERRRLGPRANSSERRSRTAAAIAAAYLNERRPGDAAPWIARSVREGSPGARLAAVAGVARTATRMAASGRRGAQ